MMPKTNRHAWYCILLKTFEEATCHEEKHVKTSASLVFSSHVMSCPSCFVVFLGCCWVSVLFVKHVLRPP